MRRLGAESVQLDGDDDDPLLSNPLSLDKTSPWQQFYAVRTNMASAQTCALVQG